MLNPFGILNDCNLLLLIKLLSAHITFSFLLSEESVTFFQADFYGFLLSETLYYRTTDFTGVSTGNPLIVRNRIEFLDEDLNERFKFVEKHIFQEHYLIQVERYHDEVKKRFMEKHSKP
jgi:hypothetical protein